MHDIVHIIHQHNIYETSCYWEIMHLVPVASVRLLVSLSELSWLNSLTNDLDCWHESNYSHVWSIIGSLPTLSKC